MMSRSEGGVHYAFVFSRPKGSPESIGWDARCRGSRKEVNENRPHHQEGDRTPEHRCLAFRSHFDARISLIHDGAIDARRYSAVARGPKPCGISPRLCIGVSAALTRLVHDFL